MPKIPGGNHLHAVRALEKAGFRILCASTQCCKFSHRHPTQDLTAALSGCARPTVLRQALRRC